jgi:hypothetical protein
LMLKTTGDGFRGADPIRRWWKKGTFMKRAAEEYVRARERAKTI